MSELKQVILVRKDLYFNGKMGVGKMAAQVAHASRNAILNQAVDVPRGKFLRMTRFERSWYDGRHTTIVKWVKNEAQLLKVYQQALDANLPCCLIRDAGLTEFEEPTLTTVGIGPADFALVNKITKKYQLAR